MLSQFGVQVTRLASGKSSCVALLWDVAQLLQQSAEPMAEALDMAHGAALPVDTPDGGAAATANDDGDIDVEALDGVDAPGIVPNTQAAPEQIAVLSPLAQVSPSPVRQEFVRDFRLSPHS